MYNLYYQAERHFPVFHRMARAERLYKDKVLFFTRGGNRTKVMRCSKVTLSPLNHGDSHIRYIFLYTIEFLILRNENFANKEIVWHIYLSTSVLPHKFHNVITMYCICFSIKSKQHIKSHKQKKKTFTLVQKQATPC